MINTIKFLISHLNNILSLVTEFQTDGVLLSNDVIKYLQLNNSIRFHLYFRESHDHPPLWSP